VRDACGAENLALKRLKEVRAIDPTGGMPIKL
jgi:hypothetical protein